MQIKNLLFITITSLSLTSVVNAEDFKLGFSSPSNTQVRHVNLSDQAVNNVKSFSLGFNSASHAKTGKGKLSAKKLANVQQKSTVLKGFSLGSNS